MRIRAVYLWILLAVFVGSSVGSYFSWKDFEPRNKALVFVTVGIDVTKIPTEVSSYELQRASEHFSDVLLGWTLEPGFRASFLEEAGPWHTLTGQRQEKQNLLFEITNIQKNIWFEDQSEAANAFLKVLENQLSEYNTATHQGYVLAVKNLSYEFGQKSPLPMVGNVLLALVLSGVLLLAYEYAQTRRRS